MEERERERKRKRKRKRGREGAGGSSCSLLVDIEVIFNDFFLTSLNMDLSDVEVQSML